MKVLNLHPTSLYNTPSFVPPASPLFWQSYILHRAKKEKENAVTLRVSQTAENEKTIQGPCYFGQAWHTPVELYASTSTRQHCMNTRVCLYTISAYSTQKHRHERLQAATIQRTCRIEAMSSLNWPKNVYFSTQECGCYIFLTLCLYFHTQGLCVRKLLFRGFLA